MNDGTSGANRQTLLGDGTFVDESGATGAWRYLLGSARLVLQYNTGMACDALLVGRFTTPISVNGQRFCQDGSDLRGRWVGMIVTGFDSGLPATSLGDSTLQVPLDLPELLAR